MPTLLLALCLLADAPPTDAAAEGRPPAQPERVLVGTVVDAEGRPLSEADVWLAGPSPTREAEIQAQARSDRQGRFRLAVPERWFTRVPQLWADDRAVYAWKPGMQLAFYRTLQRPIPPADRVRLVLRPAERTPLTLHAPDGRPVADARILLGSIDGGNGTFMLPNELSERLACRTNAEGKADFTAVPPQQIGQLIVDSERFGRQHKLVAPEGGWTAPLALRSAGRLKGRVTAEQAELVSGLNLVITTFAFNEAGGQTETGVARVTTDDEGRFDVPAIMHGPLVTQVSLPPDVPFRARTTQSKQELINKATDWAVTGELTKVEIPLEPAVRATGLVRERGTGRPIAGVTVHVLSAAGWNQFVTSDAQGQYVCHVLPPSVGAIVAPPLHYSDERQNKTDSLPIAKGAKAVELPPIELTPSPAVRGVVVDEQGQPVAGATVCALSTEPYGSDDFTLTEVSTDERGAFLMEGFHSQTGVVVTARHGEMVTDGPALRKVGETAPLTLTMSEAHRIALRGRALDPTGTPVAGATVTIRHQPYLPLRGRNQEGETGRRISFETAIVTDAEGRFQTPRELERFGFYQAEISGPSLRTERTAWLSVAAPRTTEFPDLTVSRLQAVAGRVVDSAGEPVAGARVTLDDGRTRTAISTDDTGTFRFRDAPGAMALVLVTKPGFRTAGRRVDPQADMLELSLRRTDEPPAARAAAEPSSMTAEERAALVKRLLEPLAQPKATAGEAVRAYELLAVIDPAGTLERIESAPHREADVNTAARTAVAQQLVKSSPDDALLVAESLDLPIWRGKIYLEVCDALPASRKTRKLELLGQALLQARGEKEPAFRAFMLGQVGERLLDLGETARATEVLREGERTARQLSTAAFAGYARGAFAEELAQIDVAAALELTNGLSDPFEHDRHHGNMAHELAARQPAEAERVLNMVRETTENAIIQPRDQYRVRVCYRMAPVDRERAQRLADEAHDPHQRAYAYGMMARALAKTDPSAATELLRQALAILQTAVDEGQDRFNYLFSASSVAAGLLPVAEQIDPDLVPEFLWRAVSLRLLPTDDPQQANLADQSNAVLAMLLARYDRGVAQAILMSVGASARGTEPWLTALTLVDPRRAVEYVEGPHADGAPIGRERLIVARVLAREGEELWREILKQTSLWPPDTEDLF